MKLEKLVRKKRRRKSNIQRFKIYWTENMACSLKSPHSKPIITLELTQMSNFLLSASTRNHLLVLQRVVLSKSQKTSRQIILFKLKQKSQSSRHLPSLHSLNSVNEKLKSKQRLNRKSCCKGINLKYNMQNSKRQNRLLSSKQKRRRILNTTIPYKRSTFMIISLVMTFKRILG